MNTTDQPQPEITYPCKWDYSVIAINEKSARMAVVAAAANAEVDYKDVSKSSGGKYTSLKIAITVDSKKHRDSIFALLKNSDGVKFVM